MKQFKETDGRMSVADIQHTLNNLVLDAKAKLERLEDKEDELDFDFGFELVEDFKEVVSAFDSAADDLYCFLCEMEEWLK